jgi:hypothetical protein
MTRRFAAVLSLAVLLLSAAARAQTAQNPLDQQLWDATRRGDAAAVRDLVARGANVNAKWRYDQTPLFKAAERGDAEIVKILLEAKADPNARDTFYGATPLTWASDKGHTEVVRALIGKGATGKDDVLLTGVRSGNVEYVKIALGHGETAPATLTRALVFAGTRHAAEKDEAVRAKRAEIAALLKSAGAQPPFAVEPSVLKSYEGTYKAETGPQELKISAGAEGLLTLVGPGNSLTLAPSDKVTFAPVEFVGPQITFTVEGERAVGFTLKQGQAPPQVFKRVEGK